jgi:hypothetical protein
MEKISLYDYACIILDITLPGEADWTCSKNSRLTVKKRRGYHFRPKFSG